MNIDRFVMAFAGSMTLSGVLLSLLFNPYWLLLVAFVGANLLQAAFTRVCPLATILRRFGVRPGCAF